MGESKRKGEETFGNIFKALNDLAKGQKGMLESPVGETLGVSQ